MRTVVNHLARTRNCTFFDIVDADPVTALDAEFNTYSKSAKFRETCLGNVVSRKCRHEVRILAIICERHRDICLSTAESCLIFMSL